MRLTTCITSLHFIQSQAQVTTPNKSSQVVWRYTSGVSAGVEISRADSHRPAHRPPRAQGRLLLIWSSSRLQQHFKCRGRPFWDYFCSLLWKKGLEKCLSYNHQKGLEKCLPYNHQKGFEKFIPYNHQKGLEKFIPYNHQKGLEKFIPYNYQKRLEKFIPYNLRAHCKSEVASR